MPNARSILDHQYLEMRYRLLALAADFDRIQNAVDGPTLLNSDPRALKLKKGLELLLQSDTPDRAEKFQMLLSDMTPAPK